MEIFLFAIIVIQFLILIYLDIQNRKEREKMQLKLMSKDIGDYVVATEKPEDSPKAEEDPYIPMSDASFDQILRAKEK